MTTTHANPETTRSPQVRRGNPWAPTWRGVGLVTRIELLRRRPTFKGYLFYGITFALILVLGIYVAANSAATKDSAPLELVLILILGVGVLVGPSLSATSINGDSSEGVLAPLQMTRLTAGDLAIGKLLASWAVAIAALVTLSPFLLYAFGRSGWRAWELGVVIALILFVVLVATCVGLAWSSVAARPVVSVSMAHVTMGTLMLGTLILFAMLQPLVEENVQISITDHDWQSATQEQLQDPSFNPNALPCVTTKVQTTITHEDKLAWMLLVNPVVVVAEVAPIVNPETYLKDGRAAPGLFAQIHQSVGSARLGAQVPPDEDYCAPNDGGGDNSVWEARQEASATIDRQPWLGLAVSGALGIGALALAIRRLRVPYRELRTGTRVA